MADEPRKMSINEYRSLGYLQEVNRGFFHPHGLALEVVVDDDGTERLGGIWDYRDDPEGIVFGDTTGPEFARKAEMVRVELEWHREAREALFGDVIQPLGWRPATDDQEEAADG